MVRWSVTGGGIRISSAPSQDGSTIDNQIACPDQLAKHGPPDREHKEGLKGRRSCRLSAFTQLRRARNAWLPSRVEWQATGAGKSGPTQQPIMHVPGRESRKTHFEQGDQQQGLVAVGARATAYSFGQRGWTTPMCQLNSQVA